MKYLKLFEKFDNGWDPFGEEVDNIKKNKLIKYLGETVHKYGGTLTMLEMESDFSPIVFSTDEEIHQIEIIYRNFVGVSVYDDYGEPCNEFYLLPYEDLEIDTLEELKKILDSANKVRDLIEEI